MGSWERWEKGMGRTASRGLGERGGGKDRVGEEWGKEGREARQ